MVLGSEDRKPQPGQGLTERKQLRERDRLRLRKLLAEVCDGVASLAELEDDEDLRIAARHFTALPLNRWPLDDEARDFETRARRALTKLEHDRFYDFAAYALDVVLRIIREPETARAGRGPEKDT